MLVLSRKSGEQVIIDGNIRVTVLRVSGKRVKLGIYGPKNVPIYRGELHTKGLSFSRI
jgi:carbon storage regulator